MQLWNSGNDFPFFTRFSWHFYMKDLNMPAFRSFLARKTRYFYAPQALPFGSRIASWYREVRYLAQARRRTKISLRPFTPDFCQSRSTLYPGNPVGNIFDR
jgi:hypothetical protein